MQILLLLQNVYKNPLFRKWTSSTILHFYLFLEFMWIFNLVLQAFLLQAFSEPYPTYFRRRTITNEIVTKITKGVELCVVCTGNIWDIAIVACKMIINQSKYSLCKAL